MFKSQVYKGSDRFKIEEYVYYKSSISNVKSKI